jgi:crotonobetainyl-CoA:carnitine CoA-transferase CaiB-like acyl-CoA transferase
MPSTSHAPGSLHAKSFQADAPAPLDGVRVLDLSRLVAGNVATHHLADFGAEVIKIERTAGGDDLRNWRVKGVSAHWKVYARNKKSVVLNLREARGRELLLDLVATAQVLVENYTPGRLEQMGIGPDVLLARNPRLIVLRVSGWGQTGPFREKPGFGSLIEAYSGFAARNGFPDRPPVLPPLALADMVAGIQGAYAVMVALRSIETGGGNGQVIDLSLLEPLHATIGPQALAYRLSQKVPQRYGSQSNVSAPRNVYRCRDGKYVAMSGSTQAMAERVMRTIGRPELIDDPRFRTNTDRVANNDTLDGIIADFIGSRDRPEVLYLFDSAGVTVGPVHDPADLSDDDYIREREVVVEVPDAELGSVPMHNIVPRLSETPGTFRRPAPALGEHTDEILGGLGLSAAELAALRDQGIVA